MKEIRRSDHAVQNLANREIGRVQAEGTLAEPELVVPGRSPRQIVMRRYFEGLRTSG